MSDATNIASYLTRAAEAQPHAPAIYCPVKGGAGGRRSYTHLTYRQLDEESTAIARGLAAFGIGKGVRTALMVRPSLELFTLTFALFKAGAVPVMIDPGIGARRMGTCLAEAEPEGFVGIPAAHVARLLLGWGRKTVQKVVTVGSPKLWGGTTLEALLSVGRGAEANTPLPPTDPDDMAAILFTSGSTGAPKGVVYRHRHFIGQVELLRETYGIEPGEVDLPTFPLFALFDPALGMTTVIPDMNPTRPASVDPTKLIGAIEDFGVTNMFGSPALLTTFARHGAAHGTKLDTIRRVISAGAPVPPALQDLCLQMLPEGAEIFTPYGATECLPVASTGSSELLATRAASEGGAGVCVGKPVAPNEVSIIRITDAPIARWQDAELLAQGEIGEIVVRGPTTTQRYYGRDAATEQAKITHEGEAWRSHRMGDVGYFDPDGRLWFCGRKAHRVQLEDRVLFTVPCELVFNVHPAVFRTALVGVEQGGKVLPVLCVELESGDGRSIVPPWSTLESELRDLGAAHPHTARIQHFLQHPGFPVDIRHNAKIGRGALAVWAGKQLR